MIAPAENISCHKGNAEAIHIGRRLRLVVQGGMVATNPSGLGSSWVAIWLPINVRSKMGAPLCD
jgi:hypothetical protein